MTKSNCINKMEEEKLVDKKTLIKTRKIVNEKGIRLVLQILSWQEAIFEHNKPKNKNRLRSLTIRLKSFRSLYEVGKIVF